MRSVYLRKWRISLVFWITFNLNYLSYDCLSEWSGIFDYFLIYCQIHLDCCLRSVFQDLFILLGWNFYVAPQLTWVVLINLNLLNNRSLGWHIYCEVPVCIDYQLQLKWSLEYIFSCLCLLRSGMAQIFPIGKFGIAYLIQTQPSLSDIKPNLIMFACGTKVSVLVHCRKLSAFVTIRLFKYGLHTNWIVASFALLRQPRKLFRSYRLQKENNFADYEDSRGRTRKQTDIQMFNNWFLRHSHRNPKYVVGDPDVLEISIQQVSRQSNDWPPGVQQSISQVRFIPPPSTPSFPEIMNIRPFIMINLNRKDEK